MQIPMNLTVNDVLGELTELPEEELLSVFGGSGGSGGAGSSGCSACVSVGANMGPVSIGGSYCFPVPCLGSSGSGSGSSSGAGGY